MRITTTHVIFVNMPLFTQNECAINLNQRYGQKTINYNKI